MDDIVLTKSLCLNSRDRDPKSTHPVLTPRRYNEKLFEGCTKIPQRLYKLWVNDLVEIGVLVPVASTGEGVVPEVTQRP